MSEWISVSESLPKLRRAVVVLYRPNWADGFAWEGDLAAVARFNGESWWRDHTDDTKPITVTHWMPLPDSPMADA